MAESPAAGTVSWEAPDGDHPARRASQRSMAAVAAGLVVLGVFALRQADSAPPMLPLALFGVIVALPVPLYAARLAAAPGAVGWVAYAPLTRTVSWSFSGSSLFAVFHSGGGLLGIAGGWYWAAALTAGFVLTAVGYWGGRPRPAGRGPRPGVRRTAPRRGPRGSPPPRVGTFSPTPHPPRVAWASRSS